MKNSQLLELAFHSLPNKKFKTDETAAGFGVEILRLPIKHCTLTL